MEFFYKNIKINYENFYNKSDIYLVYLHGWGQNIEMMMPIAKPFIKKYNVLIVDLPGFGNSMEPEEIWSLFDYSLMINSLVKELKIKNPILIGHSFGGKISICYALKYKVSKLVLLASPYKKSENSNSIKTKILKSLKKIPLLNKFEKLAKNYFGSTDYKNASETMRKILVTHVNTDLSNDVKEITCPTLLIWGTKDSAVKYEDAIELEKLIKDCGLVTYEGCTHYAYLERLSQTISVLNNFIGSDEK